MAGRFLQGIGLVCEQPRMASVSNSSTQMHASQFIKCPDCGRDDFRTTGGLARHRNSAVCRKTQAKNLRLQCLPSQVLHAVDDVTPLDHVKSLRRSARVLRRVPKAARQLVAEALTEILQDCKRLNDQKSWDKLMTFAHRILTAPPSKRRRGPSLAASAKANIRSNGENTTPESRERKKKNATTEEAFRKAVEMKLQDGDISGAVRLLSSEDTIAPDTPDTIESLRRKHPEAHADLQLPASPLSCSRRKK